MPDNKVDDKSNETDVTAANDGDNQTWGGWFSSVYSTVMGDTDTTAQQQPEQNENEEEEQTNLQNKDYAFLTPTTELQSNSEKHSTFDDIPEENRRALWKQLTSYIGMDVMNMRMSLPIWLFEPTTALTRMCETFEYYPLLQKAASTPDKLLSDFYVAAFVISAFAHTERVKKPLNPCLGEVFAFKKEGFRFISEQVSHHPPIGVSFGEGPDWTAGETVDIVAMYLGNSIQVRNTGSRFIELKRETGREMEKENVRYEWSLPTAGVSNLFIGGAFVDHYGEIEIKCRHSIMKLQLSKCGWFSKGRYEVNGEYRAIEEDGKESEVLARFSGYWNKYLDVEKVEKRPGEGIMRIWMAGDHLLEDEEAIRGSMLNCTKWTREILRQENEEGVYLEKSDSRFRPDRTALEIGDSATAAEEKLKIEQLQRERIKKWEENEKKFKPRWFRKNGKDERGKEKWEYSGEYWRAAKEGQVHEGGGKILSLW